MLKGRIRGLRGIYIWIKPSSRACLVICPVNTPASLPFCMNATLGTALMPKRLAMPVDYR